jgi:hypothetical protein
VAGRFEKPVMIAVTVQPVGREGKGDYRKLPFASFPALLVPAISQDRLNSLKPGRTDHGNDRLA